MKKILLVLGLSLALGTGAFANGLEIGPSAMLRFPFALDDDLSAFSTIGVEDFKFGADAELIFGILQIGALVDYRAGREAENVQIAPSLEILATGGVLLDLWILRVGAGVGPTFIVDFPSPDAPAPPEGQPGNVGLGLGVKGNVDLQLGPIALRLNVISGLDLLRSAAADNALEYMDVKVGLSLLFAL